MDIASQYAWGEFPLDLQRKDVICLIPFHWIADLPPAARFIIYIKVLRLLRASDLLSVKVIQNQVQTQLRKRSEWVIENDKDLASNAAIDHNYIGHVIMFGFGLRFMKNVIVFFSLAYFGGIIWLYWCYVCLKFINPRDDAGEPLEGSSFLLVYDLDFSSEARLRSAGNTITAVMYFMMTTMSTVGFGDLHPKSDAERLACVLVFLVGGTFYSIVMGDFLDILSQYCELRANFDEGDKLSQFIGLLRYLNEEKPLSEQFRLKLRTYFDWRWKHDLNQGIDGEEELAILAELPDDRQDQIYASYLFRDFLRNYFSFFRVSWGSGSAWGNDCF